MKIEALTPFMEEGRRPILTKVVVARETHRKPTQTERKGQAESLTWLISCANMILAAYDVIGGNPVIDIASYLGTRLDWAINGGETTRLRQLAEINMAVGVISSTAARPLLSNPKTAVAGVALQLFSFVAEKAILDLAAKETHHEDMIDQLLDACHLK